MPWFTTKGQIFQLLLALAAVCLAGLKAWPDMKMNDYFSGGAILFYILVALVVGSVVHLMMSVRKGASVPRTEEVAEVAELKAKLEEKVAAALMRDAIISTRDQTIAELKAQLAERRSGRKPHSVSGR